MKCKYADSYSVNIGFRGLVGWWNDGESSEFERLHVNKFERLHYHKTDTTTLTALSGFELHGIALHCISLHYLTKNMEKQEENVTKHQII